MLLNQLLLQLLKKAKLVISWAASNLRLFIEILLVAALFIAGWLYRVQERKLEAAKAEYGKLADNLQSQITIRDGQITILKRQGGKVITNTVYVPVEGPVIIIQPKPTQGDPNPDPIIQVKTKGWCFRPGIGAEIASMGLQARLDAKVAYWERYSGLVGGTRYGAGIAVSRHLDDVLWFKPRNIEAFVSYNILRAAGLTPVTIGVRSNF